MAQIRALALAAGLRDARACCFLRNRTEQYLEFDDLGRVRISDNRDRNVGYGWAGVVNLVQFESLGESDKPGHELTTDAPL